MMHFLNACRKFLLCTTVHYSSLSSKTQSRTRSVHCHITATDNHHLLSGMYRSIVVRTVRFHQVIAGEELICGEHAVEMFARDVHETRKTCT